MKLLVFSDLHYFAGDIEKAIFNTKEKLVGYALPMLDRLTEIINNEFEADLAVNLGDTIQDTTEHDSDIEALKFIYEKLGAIKCPCVTLLGNHDLKMMDSADEVESILGKKTTLSLDMEGWHLVFLTTEARPELGTGRGGCYKAQYLADATLSWLETDLSENKLPTLIFTHYPICEDPNHEDECMFMKNRDEVKKIIKKYGNVRAVFSGHQHLSKTFIEDGIPHFLVGSLIADWKMLGTPDGSYLEIRIEDEFFSVSNCRILKEELNI